MRNKFDVFAAWLGILSFPSNLYLIYADSINDLLD